MKLIKQGELYSLDHRAGLDVQLMTARKKFRLKHGKEATGVWWNPKGFKDARAMEIVPVDPNIPPGHLWLEIDNGD